MRIKIKNFHYYISTAKFVTVIFQCLMMKQRSKNYVKFVFTEKLCVAGPGGGPLHPGRNSEPNAGVFVSGARTASLLVAKTLIWDPVKKGVLKCAQAAVGV